MAKQQYSIGETIISLTGVCKSYPDQPNILVDVNLDIRNINRSIVEKGQGQVISLIGVSGAGKTTVLDILSGLLKSTSGTALIWNSDKKCLEPTAEGKVGVVFQDYPLIDHFTVMENLMITARKQYKVEKDARTACLAIAKQYKIDGLLNQLAINLSGGQRQRVAIAQMVLCGHKLILMDEPFSGLDPIVKEEIIESLYDLAQTDEYITIIIVSHDFRSALMASDEMYFLGKHLTKPGNTIRAKIDLKERGLAWRPELWDGPEFTALEQEAKKILKDIQ